MRGKARQQGNKAVVKTSDGTRFVVRYTTFSRGAICLFTVAALITVVPALGQSGGGYAITKYAIGGGGGQVSGGDYAVTGTAGQPAAAEVSGGDYSLTGGFWFETPEGDCNASGILDLADHAVFVDCLSGPNVQVEGDCLCFDTNRSGTVDLRDFAGFQEAYTE